MNTLEGKDIVIKRRRYSLVLWVLILGVVVAGVWAYKFRIDQSTRCMGTVIATSRVQIIQAVDGGVLETLNVKEGDQVEKGQTLAILNQTRFNASVKELDARLAGLKAIAARLRAELTDADSITFTQDVEKFPEIISVQKALFKQRRHGFKEELRVMDVSIKLAREEADLIRDLVKTGDVSRSEIIRTERMLNEAEGKLINRKNKYYQDASGELAMVEDEIAQNEQVRTQRVQQLNDSVFTAPVVGIVKNVRVTTLGGVLRSGEELMQIIPLDDQLIVEAKVRPSDIADLRPGLPVHIRFDAFDYTIYGAVQGMVSYVSGDTLREQTQMGEMTYYRVHVKTSGSPVVTSIGKELEILPGMTAQVDIHTGERTVLEFLLKPLRKTLTESFNEK